jgi:hypothetical protein
MLRLTGGLENIREHFALSTPRTMQLPLEWQCVECAEASVVVHVVFLTMPEELLSDGCTLRLQLLQAAQSHRSALQIGLNVVNRVLAAQPREFVLDTANSGAICDSNFEMTAQCCFTTASISCVAVSDVPHSSQARGTS